MRLRLFTTSVLLLGLFLSTAHPQSQANKEEKQTTLRQEEQEDYYKKWLNEDVKYIITDEEGEIFRSLSTAEEKEQFIEQFWFRRAPDPRTAINEFKEEHYRRIAYANEHFESGLAGWRTDRGRVYIIHGPPDEIERHPSGGAYERPIHEGGGRTATYPFELWRYRHIEGLGSGIELEFVDKRWTEDYRLALTADEKDVFLNVPGFGLTRAEQLGLATKFQRLQVRMNPGSRELYPLTHHRIQDSIFARYETFAKVKRPTEIKYKDLKEAVKIDISYQNFPFKVREDYFKLNDEQVLVPITLEFPNENLTFRLENDVQKAKIAVYGVVTSLTNQIITEFEDDLITSYRPEYLEHRLKGRTRYQKILVLDQDRRHKLSLVAKDVISGNVGVMQTGIVSPSFDGSQIAVSSLVLADFIRSLGEVSTREQMFVLGDVKVRPTANHIFPINGVLGIYLQLYNAALDQSTLAPSVGVSYRILQDGKTVLEIVDENGASIHSYSDRRVVLIKGVPLKGLGAGKYRVEVKVQDHIKNESVDVSEEFQITTDS